LRSRKRRTRKAFGSTGMPSVPLHLVNGYQMIVPVSIDHSGPYEFLLDTGSQFTMIDPSLAAELYLDARGSVSVTGNGFHTTASAVELDRLEVGRHAVPILKRWCSTCKISPSTRTSAVSSARIFFFNLMC
jgi:hypothetical protein